MSRPGSNPANEDAARALAAATAHSLANIANTLLLQLALLEQAQGNGRPALAANAFEQVRCSGERLARLVSHLRDVAAGRAAQPERPPGAAPGATPVTPS